jgi:hypothetical protein
MSTPGKVDPTTNENVSLATPQTVFPYITTSSTTFTNNYTVYAGTCSSALPPTANQTYATVSPAATPSVVVQEPVLNVSVTYNGSAVKPAHVSLKDACNDTWYAAIAAGSTKPTTGWLASPGQPYGASYTVCADYIYTGTSYRKATATVSNTSFTATNGNAVTVAIPNSTTSTFQGLC